MTGLGQVTPACGVRIELTLTSVDADHARYACVMRMDTAAYEGQVTVSSARHEVELIDLADAPEWTRTFTCNLLRTIARGVADDRWPRRLTRWRTEPSRRKRSGDG